VLKAHCQPKLLRPAKGCRLFQRHKKPLPTGDVAGTGMKALAGGGNRWKSDLIAVLQLRYCDWSQNTGLKFLFVSLCLERYAPHEEHGWPTAASSRARNAEVLPCEIHTGR